MLSDIKKYILGCEQYQITKYDWQRKQNLLYSNKVSHQLWDIISLDFVGLLLISKKYNRIIVVIDRFSNMAQYIPIIINIISKEVAKSLWE